MFKVGLYEVLLNSQCITYSRWQSAGPQPRDADRRTGIEAKQYFVVNDISSLALLNHLEPPKNLSFNAHYGSHDVRISKLMPIPRKILNTQHHFKHHGVKSVKN